MPTLIRTASPGRRAVIGAGAALLAAGAWPARAQPAFPSQPVRMLIPLAAGTLTDIIGRLLAEPMARHLGQPVVVDNRPGANGVVSVAALKQARPDGHTVLLAGVSLVSFNPHLYRNLGYDPATDFSYIAPVVNTGFMLVASPRSGLASVAQFVERAKAKPGEVTFGSVGVGNSTHLAMEMVADAAGLRLSHVPYPSSAPVAALMRGEVDTMLATIGTVINQARAGQVVPLAVLLDRRAPELPDVPTLREAGIEAPTMPGWYALVGPAGVPMPAQEKLNAAMAQTLSEAPVRERLAGMYLEPIPGTPETIRRTYERDSAVWGAFIRRRGVVLD